MKTPRFEELAQRFAGKVRFFFIYASEAHARASSSERINAFADGIAAMDRDGDGATSRAEFAGPAFMFEAFDLDADGVVRSHELLSARRIDDFASFERPASLAERRAAASRFRAEVPGQIPVLVDRMDDRTALDYGGLPNSAFVIDRDGVVRAKMTWASVSAVETALVALLGDGAQPARASAPAAIDWQPIAPAMQRAARSGRPLLLAFEAAGCAACARMEESTLADPAVRARFLEHVVVRLDLASDANWRLFERLELTSTPSFVLIAPNGRLLRRLEGYQDSAAMMRFLGREAVLE